MYTPMILKHRPFADKPRPGFEACNVCGCLVTLEYPDKQEIHGWNWTHPNRKKTSYKLNRHFHFHWTDDDLVCLRCVALCIGKKQAIESWITGRELATMNKHPWGLNASSWGQKPIYGVEAVARIMGTQWWLGEPLLWAFEGGEHGEPLEDEALAKVAALRDMDAMKHDDALDLDLVRVNTIADFHSRYQSTLGRLQR